MIGSNGQQSVVECGRVRPVGGVGGFYGRAFRNVLIFGIGTDFRHGRISGPVGNHQLFSVGTREKFYFVHAHTAQRIAVNTVVVRVIHYVKFAVVLN